MKDIIRKELKIQEIREWFRSIDGEEGYKRGKCIQHIGKRPSVENCLDEQDQGL